MLAFEHVTGDVVAKHLDLLSDVANKSVTGPSTHNHDGVDRDVGEAHCHGGTGQKRVSANILGFKSKKAPPKTAAAALRRMQTSSLERYEKVSVRSQY